MTGLALTVTAACSDQEVEPISSSSEAVGPTLTPSAQPTSTLVPTVTFALPSGSPSAGFDAFRTFALEIEAAVSSGNTKFFESSVVETEVTCAGDEQLGQCMNQPAGTVIRGISGAAWRSDVGGLIPRVVFLQMLTDWFAAAIPSQSDPFGDGAPRLYALGESSEGEFLAITSLIRDTGSYPNTQRQCRIFRFSPLDGNWVLRGEIFCWATETAEDWLSGVCNECHDYWEPWVS
jgi:hypothetical protein